VARQVVVRDDSFEVELELTPNPSVCWLQANVKEGANSAQGEATGGLQAVPSSGGGDGGVV
jgi:hypothetical protein